MEFQRRRVITAIDLRRAGACSQGIIDRMKRNGFSAASAPVATLLRRFARTDDGEAEYFVEMAAGLDFRTRPEEYGMKKYPGLRADGDDIFSGDGRSFGCGFHDDEGGGWSRGQEWSDGCGWSDSFGGGTGWGVGAGAYSDWWQSRGVGDAAC